VTRDQSTWGLAEGDELVPGRHAVRLLGGGTRYEAYLCWDDGLHGLVVAKALRPERVGDDDRAVLAREAELLAALAHPGLVRSLDAVVDGPRPHIVLEHLNGPRLSTLIRRYGVVAEQALPLALSLCSVLHYLAGRGVVHLDVKPKNVIMGASPRLLDLSVAMRIEDVAGLAEPTGTDAYMAPEQCDPARFDELGPPADVWGLGVTLYEALAGRLPFPRGTGDEAASPPERYPQLVLAPAPPPVGAAPDEVVDAVLACLEPRPANRPAPAELATALEPWAAALPRPRLGRFRPGDRVRPTGLGRA
jgi:eukaryotic-like serine/threonine-protein kinase